MGDILSEIRKADSAQLNEIVRAVLGRYDALFPEEEVFFLSLPKNDGEVRYRVLEEFCHMAQHGIKEK